MRAKCRVLLPSGGLCGKAGVDNWLARMDGVDPDFAADVPICGIHQARFLRGKQEADR